MADLRALADEDLMQLVSRADPAAFEILYERHSKVSFSLAYRIMGTRNAAEDVVQEAFLNLWRSGARFERSRGSVRTWVLGIVHHRAIDALRRATVHDRRRATSASVRSPDSTRSSSPSSVARRRSCTVARRSASMARWWTMPSTHVRTEPRERSKRAPERQRFKNASCTTSSAALRVPMIR